MLGGGGGGGLAGPFVGTRLATRLVCSRPVQRCTCPPMTRKANDRANDSTPGMGARRGAAATPLPSPSPVDPTARPAGVLDAHKRR